jgi:protoporphyrinogen oxidase
MRIYFIKTIFLIFILFTSLESISAKIYDAVIVGGGISGLNAAYLLKKYNILVLEKEDYVGGRTHSGKWEGFYYPKGTEYIGKPDKYTAGIFKKLGIKPVSMPMPSDAVFYKGKKYYGKDFFGFLTKKESDNYDKFLTKIEKIYKKGVKEDTISEKPQKLIKLSKLDIISVAKWLSKYKIKGVVAEYVDIENRGLFGAANADLSLLLNVPELYYNFDDYYKPEKYKPPKPEVFSFKLGMHELPLAFAKKLPGKIITKAEVTKIKRLGKEKFDIYYKKSGKEEKVTAETVILATPAPVTAKIGAEILDKKVLSNIKKIKYSGYITLNIFLKKRMWHEAWSASCIGEFFVTVYDSVRTQVSKDYRGKSILGIYIASENLKDKSLYNLSDKQILDKSLADLEKYFPGITPGYLKIITYLKKHKKLKGPIFLAGDYLTYATVDGAISSGEQAADKWQDWWKD